MLDDWNDRYAAEILSKFVITIGDEFQGLVGDPVIVPRLIRELETGLPTVQVRIGIGYGKLETDLEPMALGMDGRVWHAARAALEAAKEDGRLGGVFEGFEEWTAPLNGLARTLWVQYDGMTNQQRRIVDLMEKHRSQTEVANLLQKKQPAISQTLKAVHLSAIREAEQAWSGILERFRQR